MAELKTKKTKASVAQFLQSIPDKEQQNDSVLLNKMFTQMTGEKPAMWGTSIVGYGMYHYKSERSSQEGDWMLTGFSPRKQNLTLYVFPSRIKASVLKALGPHKKSGGCLYIKRLSDVDHGVLKQIIKTAHQEMKKLHNATK